MNCENCGGIVPPGTNRCPKCGNQVQQPAAAPGGAQQQQPTIVINQPGAAQGAVAAPPKSKIAAGLFGIFLGGFGIHRFYLGYGGIGAAQLVLTIIGWLTICFVVGIVLVIAAWLWGLIEGILILAGVMNQDAYGRPLT